MLDIRFVRRKPRGSRHRDEEPQRFMGFLAFLRTRRGAPRGHHRRGGAAGGAQCRLESHRPDDGAGQERRGGSCQRPGTRHQREDRRSFRKARGHRGRPERSAARHAEHASRFYARGRRRERQPRSSPLGRSHASSISNTRLIGIWAPNWASSTSSVRVKLAAQPLHPAGGPGARLERALINFMADTHTSRGLQGVVVPGDGQRRYADGHRSASQVRRGPVQNDRGALPHPHGRGAAHQHSFRRGA